MKKYISTTIAILTLAIVNIYVSKSARKTIITDLQLDNIEAVAESGEWWTRIVNAASGWVASKFSVSRYKTVEIKCKDASRVLEVGGSVDGWEVPISGSSNGIIYEQTCQESSYLCVVVSNGELSCIAINCYGHTTNYN